MVVLSVGMTEHPMEVFKIQFSSTTLQDAVVVQYSGKAAMVQSQIPTLPAIMLMVLIWFSHRDSLPRVVMVEQSSLQEAMLT